MALHLHSVKFLRLPVVICFIYRPVPKYHVSILTFQLQLRASDGRDPPRISNATVTVSITRDESTPQFFGTPYDNARVSENAEIGRVFFNRVRAADQDLQVRTIV